MFDPHSTSFDAPLHVPALLAEVDSILQEPMSIPNEQCILVRGSYCIPVIDANAVSRHVRLFKPSRILPLSRLNLDEVCALPQSVTRDALLIGYLAAVKNHKSQLGA